MSDKSNNLTCDLSKMPGLYLGGSAIGRAALKIALDELNLGAREIGGNNCGKWVNKYLNNLAPEGSSWCAGFVSYCFQKSGFPMPFDYTLSARQLHNQLRQNNWSYDRSDKIIPAPGDIVIWWRNKRESWRGHSGIVHHFRNGYLFTIEGNRSSKVEGFSYKLKGMRKLLGFGHIPDMA